jgi:hypothetical protein
LQRKGEVPYRTRYRKNEWGEITPSISVPGAYKIIAAMPKGEFKDLLFNAVKSESKKQAEPANKIPPPPTVKPEETGEIIQIYVPATKRESVKLMIEDMDKLLDKKNQAILSIKYENDTKKELQGELSGLKQVKVECDDLYKNMKNDLQPFALLSEQIKQDEDEKMKQNKNPIGILKGLIRGLTEGRNFIEKVLSREFKDDEYTPEIQPVTENDKKTPKRSETEANKPKKPDGR